ncbi:MAG: GMC oxidoreductase [bacterium]
MRKTTVAIVGSGIIGTTLAHILSRNGFAVEIFEKGPVYPYPHSEPFTERIFYLYSNPRYRLPKDLKNHTLSGVYQHDLEKERGMVVGGSGTYWTGLTIRMHPNDFKTRSLYGYGQDWPFTYEDLEPYYGLAERFMGVSGTDADNPFAPPRSQPYPLPEFKLSYDDTLLAERLRKNNITLHTTPQATARHPYDGRDGCENFGTCSVCPIGARYSPNHHLERLINEGLCKLHTNVSVRRVVLDPAGQAKALVYQPNEGGGEKEHPADIIIVAAAAIESSRLLLLSKSSQHPDGLGNAGGQVGRHITFHHLWNGLLRYKEKLFPGRIGPMTGQSQQFLDPPARGQHGGIKVEFASAPGFRKIIKKWGDEQKIYKDLQPRLYSRGIVLHSESAPSAKKYISLSEKKDRFGDPFAHVHYECSEFDHETYRFARELFDRFATATQGEKIHLDALEAFDSGAHHLGGCRMGLNARDSVVDQYGKLHSCANLFLAGGSLFPGTSGAVNPTLTMAALAFRAGDYIVDQFKNK